jgi:hypothetical protein
MPAGTPRRIIDAGFFAVFETAQSGSFRDTVPTAEHALFELVERYLVISSSQQEFGPAGGP